MSTVESVLQVNACLSDQIVPSHHVIVIDQHSQQRLLRKLCMHLKGSERRNRMRMMPGLKKCNQNCVLPPKDRIQLFRDVIISVFDFVLAKPKNNVRVRFPIRVGRVQVRCLQKENRMLHLTSSCPNLIV